MKFPYVVSMYGVAIKDGSKYIVTELCDLGDLGSLLRYRKSKLNIQNLVSMAKMAASGMNFLSSRKIIHKDLAARNLLVKTDGKKYLVKVADFGLSISGDNQKKGVSFPIRWTAPEAFLTGYVVLESDVWSFGVVMHEIITYGDLPYNEFSNKDVQAKVLDGYILPQMDAPDEYHKIKLSCLKKKSV